eukprot:1818396-Rhodomonas_salina.2
MQQRRGKRAGKLAKRCVLPKGAFPEEDCETLPTSKLLLLQLQCLVYGPSQYGYRTAEVAAEVGYRPMIALSVVKMAADFNLSYRGEFVSTFRGCGKLHAAVTRRHQEVQEKSEGEKKMGGGRKVKMRYLPSSSPHPSFFPMPHPVLTLIPDALMLCTTGSSFRCSSATRVVRQQKCSNSCIRIS